MNLKDRIHRSVSKRKCNVVLRKDFVEFGSPSQISEALRTLQNENFLERVSSGVYAKVTTKDHDGKRRVPSTVEIVTEAYQRLGISVQSTHIKPDHIDVKVRGHKKITRSFIISGHSVRIVPCCSDESVSVPDDVDELPTIRVGEYVALLARTHHVRYQRTAMEMWAQAVSSAAGDDVKVDNTGGLLIRLKQRNILNAAQFTRLLVNYRREHSFV